MSRYGLQIARKYGEKLKTFHDVSEAQEYFLSCKERLLNELATICKQNSAFLPDYSIESLKKIEKWYFELYENKEFQKLGVTKDEFESMMSVYFGEVVVKNNEDAKWIVEEYAFTKNKYELMVNQGYCSMSIMNKCHNHDQAPSNKRRNLLFREYNKYFQ